MLPPATVEDQLSRELTSLLDTVNALSALSHSGKWPKTQVMASAAAAHKTAGHALRINELLRGWR